MQDLHGGKSKSLNKIPKGPVLLGIDVDEETVRELSARTWRG